MSSKQVRNVIKQGFSDKKLATWTYLRCGSDGLLNVSESQSLSGGDVISKFSKGSSKIGSLVGVGLAVEECDTCPDPMTYLKEYEV